MSEESPIHDSDLRRFFDLFPELLCVIGDESRFTFVNSAWFDLLGWTEAELLGQRVQSFIHPADLADVDAHFVATASADGPTSLGFRFRTPGGDHRVLRWSARFDESGLVYAAARDFTRWADSLERAERSEGLYRAVLETAVDPVILIDGRGVIQEANPATEKLFGYNHGDLVGQNVAMLMPEPYRSEHDGYISRYLDTGERRIIGIGREVEARCSDGKTFPISLSVSEVPNTSVPLFTGIIHDLSSRHLAEQKLREANELLEQRVGERTAELADSMDELARSNRDLEQFAYIASHDLQAPLRNVRQGLEMLDDHLEQTMAAGFDDEAQELRRLVVGSVGTMEDLIRGLLSYARVQRRVHPSTEQVDLNELVADVVRQLQPVLDDAGASVESTDLPVVRGDRTQLRQLVQNLVQNAVKYRAADRSPAVRLEASGEADHWRISVVDNGLGIDPTQHERIFELFRRAHPGYEGVGLGLAICQRIVERHGGEIWVDSSPGEGSTFSFTLPTEGAVDG